MILWPPLVVLKNMVAGVTSAPRYVCHLPPTAHPPHPTPAESPLFLKRRLKVGMCVSE